MAEPAGVDINEGFRELLREFRGVGSALGAIMERTARLETKVDRLVADQVATAGIQATLIELKAWVRSEMEARSNKGRVRGLWLGAVATVAGGIVGAVFAHFWK